MKHKHKGKTSKGLFEPELIINRVLKKGNVVLDVGCGSGFLSIAAAEKVGETGKVFAVDYDTDAIPKLTEENSESNLIAINADVTQGFELPQKVDVILISNVFHGFVINKETDKAMSKIMPKLKTKGTIAVVEFVNKKTPKGPPLEHRISKGKLNSTLFKFGFSRIDHFDVGENNYCAVYQKQ